MFYVCRIGADKPKTIALFVVDKIISTRKGSDIFLYIGFSLGNFFFLIGRKN